MSPSKGIKRIKAPGFHRSKESDAISTRCYKHLVSELDSEASDFPGPPTLQLSQQNASVASPNAQTGSPSTPESNLFAVHNKTKQNKNREYPPATLV